MGLLLLLITILTTAMDYTISDNDTFFHIKVGEYISKHGFPTSDPFSMHNLSYTTHEWLSDLIFYKVYSSFGFLGLALLLCVLTSILILVLYKTNNLLNGNLHHMSFLFTFGSIYVLNLFKFLVVRPHVFSFIMFTIEIFLIESYMKSKRKLYLAFIPLLSLFLANLHIGTLPMFIILFLPYIAGSLIGFDKKRIYSEGNKTDLKWLSIVLFTSIAAAFINPYGPKKMIYFTILFDSNTQTVYEWQSPSFKGAQGILIFSTFILGIMIMILSRSKINLKNILMYFGLLFMSLYSIRYYSYFMLISGPVLGNVLFNDIKVKPFNLFSLKAGKRMIFNTVPVLLLISALVFKFSHNFESSNLDKFPVNSVNYLRDNTDYKSIKVFNDYTYGGYIMLNGIRVFIDSRQDLYLNAYNSNCTVYTDYLNVIRGKAHYKDIFDKYDFQYFIITKNSLLDTYVSSDTAYRKILEDKDCILYEKN